MTYISKYCLHSADMDISEMKMLYVKVIFTILTENSSITSPYFLYWYFILYYASSHPHSLLNISKSNYFFREEMMEWEIGIRLAWMPFSGIFSLVEECVCYNVPKKGQVRSQGDRIQGIPPGYLEHTTHFWLKCLPYWVTLPPFIWGRQSI